MRLASVLQLPRRTYAELDYARHMPKAYVDRVKRHVSVRDFDNRFGAPMLRRYNLPPDDHIDVASRPWEPKYTNEAYARARNYQFHLHGDKFFRVNRRRFTPLAPEKWTIFPGDTVQVMIGRDSGKQGIVSHVIREHNAVFVDGLHTKLVEHKNASAAGKPIPLAYIYEMQPLDPTKGQVLLVDPNDNDTCAVNWVQSAEDEQEYVRISSRTGYRIPLPSQAYVTYEYVNKASYLESVKDTPSAAVLRSTYDPSKKLQTFEDELGEAYDIADSPQGAKPTYWY